MAKVDNVSALSQICAHLYTYVFVLLDALCQLHGTQHGMQRSIDLLVRLVVNRSVAIAFRDALETCIIRMQLVLLLIRLIFNLSE